MVNKERIKLWVDALRSGEYKQGEGRLARVNNTYCCLGVACDLAIKNGVDIIRQIYIIDNCYSYDDEASFLPLKVREWLGFNSNDTHGKLSSSRYDTLTKANDSGLSFNEIADLIEQEYINVP